MEHLETNNILVNFPHGFRKGHSCESQLINTIESLARSLDQNAEVDMAILDFSKAFDTVPHQRLLKKLKFYGINGNTLNWRGKWLTSRPQTVIVDGEEFTTVPVTSGVPQGTVLGPLVFLIYINDIGNNLSEGTHIKLFADDCLVFRETITAQDNTILQKDLDNLTKWANNWQMKFNTDKCHILKITNRRQSKAFNYTMFGSTLTNVEHHPYLGIEISQNLRWKEHIQMATNKANRTLGFVRRNLGKCSEDTKKSAYTTLIRPQLEYASSVWDPHYKTEIDELEKVQRRAIRFIKNNHDRTASVTSMQNELKLPNLQQRRQLSRLTIFYKAVNNQVAVDLPDYMLTSVRETRSYHQKRFTRLSTRTNTYKYSYNFTDYIRAERLATEHQRPVHSGVLQDSLGGLLDVNTRCPCSK